MQKYDIEQLISVLVVSSSNDTLREISQFLVEVRDYDLNKLICKLFQPLLTLEHWAWEILSRDSRQWNNSEQQYLELFSNLSSFNIKLILGNENVATKEAFLLPTNIHTVDRIFEQIKQRQHENDQLLSIIFLWFDNLSLLTNEHLEIASVSIMIHINERITSDIIMTDQFKTSLNQLQSSSPTFTTKQLFYTKTCIFSLSGYIRSKPGNFLCDGKQIMEHLAKDYTHIILIHSQTVTSWSKELLSCIARLIGFIVACQRWIGTNEEILKMFVIPNKTVYDYIESLIAILSYQSFNEKNHHQWSEDESMLVHNIVELFNYLMNFRNILLFFRLQKTLINTLLKLDHIHNDQLYLLIYCLQFDILSEKQIRQLNITTTINEIFFFYLRQTWKNSSKIYKKLSIEELLEGN